MADPDEIRYAVLRVLVEANGAGVTDEAIVEGVSCYVVAELHAIADQVAELSAIGIIERGRLDERWRLTEKPA